MFFNKILNRNVNWNPNWILHWIPNWIHDWIPNWITDWLEVVTPKWLGGTPVAVHIWVTLNDQEKNRMDVLFSGVWISSSFPDNFSCILDTFSLKAEYASFNNSVYKRTWVSLGYLLSISSLSSRVELIPQFCGKSTIPYSSLSSLSVGTCRREGPGWDPGSCPESLILSILKNYVTNRKNYTSKTLYF